MEDSNWWISIRIVPLKFLFRQNVIVIYDGWMMIGDDEDDDWQWWWLVMMMIDDDGWWLMMMMMIIDDDGWWLMMMGDNWWWWVMIDDEIHRYATTLPWSLVCPLTINSRHEYSLENMRAIVIKEITNWRYYCSFSRKNTENEASRKWSVQTFTAQNSGRHLVIGSIML